MQTKMDEEEARKIIPKQTKEKKMALSDLQLKRMAARIQIIIDNHSRACSLESKSGSSNTDSNRSRREEPSTSMQTKMDEEEEARKITPKQTKEKKMVLSDLQLKRMAARIQIIIDNHSRACSLESNSGSSKRSRREEPSTSVRVSKTRVKRPKRKHSSKNAGSVNANSSSTRPKRVLKPRSYTYMATEESIDEEIMDDDSEVNYCDCGREFTNMAQLERHRLKCSHKDSDYELKESSDSANELSAEKSGESSTIESDIELCNEHYACYCCDKSFKILINLIKHSCNKVNKGKNLSKDEVFNSTIVQEVDVVETLSNNEEESSNGKTDKDNQIDGIEVNLDSTAGKTDVQEVDVDETLSKNDENGNNCKDDNQIDAIEVNLDSTAGKTDVQEVDVDETLPKNDEKGNNCKADKDDNQIDAIEVNLDSTTGKTDVQEVDVDETLPKNDEKGNNCKADKDDNQIDAIEVNLDSTTGKTDVQEVDVDETLPKNDEKGNNCKADKDDNQIDAIEVNLDNTTGKTDLQEVNVDETPSNSEENVNNCKADKDHDNQMDGIEVNLDRTAGKLDLQEIDANETLSNSVIDNVEKKDGIKELCNGESGGDNQVDSIDVIQSCTTDKNDETLPISPNAENDDNEEKCIINQDDNEISASEIDEKSAKRLQENEIAAEIEKQVTSGTCVFARINRNGEIIKTKRIVLNKKYICTECNQKLQSATDFACHQLRHENERASVSYECKACQEIFCINADLQLHENQIHNGGHLPYKCPHCEERYKSLTEADVHLLRTHDKFSSHFPYKCQECMAVLQSPSRFQKHMEVHANQKLREKFSCKLCERTFLCPSKLRKHMLTHKKYACEICGKTYSMRRLGVHMESHATVKKFECPVCKKRFSQSSNRSKHMRVHTGEKPYECNICQKTFNHKVSLKTHKKSKHNIDWWADNGVMKVQVSAEEKRILRLLGKKT